LRCPIWPSRMGCAIALLHVLAVEASITDADVLCSAALHDVIEDCAETPQEREQRAAEIEDRFGNRNPGQSAL
jgi:(p)ppGpp synthase/HD superfamily hydrolase